MSDPRCREGHPSPSDAYSAAVAAELFRSGPRCVGFLRGSALKKYRRLLLGTESVNRRLFAWREGVNPRRLVWSRGVTNLALPGAERVFNVALLGTERAFVQTSVRCWSAGRLVFRCLVPFSVSALARHEPVGIARGGSLLPADSKYRDVFSKSAPIRDVRRGAQRATGERGAGEESPTPGDASADASCLRPRYSLNRDTRRTAKFAEPR